MARRRYSSPDEAFAARVVKDPSGCWLWTGATGPKGYGTIGIGDRRTQRVHRFSYERAKGPIPKGLQLDHLCRVRNCVNPDHLEPVTNRENAIRGVEARPCATHCKRGHRFTPCNTYTHPKRGTRHCRACQTERERAR